MLRVTARLGGVAMAPAGLCGTDVLASLGRGGISRGVVGPANLRVGAAVDHIFGERIARTQRDGLMRSMAPWAKQSPGD